MGIYLVVGTFQDFEGSITSWVQPVEAKEYSLSVPFTGLKMEVERNYPLLKDTDSYFDVIAVLNPEGKNMRRQVSINGHSLLRDVLYESS